MELLKQSGETLAGRVSYAELTPFDILELGEESIDPLWVRGGFPGSILAVDDATSLRWRRDFIRTYLERDIPQFGVRIPAETLRRFWTMLAHSQAGILNAAQLARGIGVTGSTVAHYLDLLVDLLLVAPASTLAQQRRQTPGKVAQGLHSRQWAGSRATRAREQGGAVEPSDRRR